MPGITTFDMEHLFLVIGSLLNYISYENYKLNRVNYVNQDRSKAAR